MSLIDANDLKNWATIPNSRHELPALFRNLLYAFSDNLTLLNIPSGSSVNLGGWDGQFKLKTDNLFLSAGDYVAEFSCEGQVKRKADYEYKNRTEGTSTTERKNKKFIFITARSYKNKNKWLKEKRAKKQWKEVHFLDCHDISQWFDLSPTETQKMLIAVGKIPDRDVRPLMEFWETWSKLNRVTITPDLVIAKREEAVKKIFEWLQGKASVLRVQGVTKEESIAFLCAVIEKSDKQSRDQTYSKSLTVKSADAWYQMQKHKSKLILIPDYKGEHLPFVAEENGHHVYLPYDKDDGDDFDLLLQPPRKDYLRDELEKIGLKRPVVERIVRSSGANLITLRRKLTKDNTRPDWYTDVVAVKLLPALMVGGWTESESDLSILESLSSLKSAQLLGEYQTLSTKADPPIKMVNRKWELVSHDEMWSLLSKLIIEAHLKPFSEIAISALGTFSPEFELPSEERYMAGIKGKMHPYSSKIRHGIAQTLALMGSTVTGPNSDQLNSYANYVVRAILKNSDQWQLWASLGEYLSMLAEASPNEMLNAIEEALESPKNPFLELFKQEGDGFWGGCPHSGLLWSLETMGWSNDHFSRVALALAKLAEIDPGGRYSNRPNESLRALFLAWKQYCESNNETRLKVLDMLLKKTPRAGWRLLIELCPSGTQTITDRNRPQKRNWGRDVPENVNRQDMYKYMLAIVDKIFTNVGTDLNRWNDIFQNITFYSPDQRKEIFNDIQKILTKKTNTNDGGKLRATLRDLLNRHRSYPDTDWAMSAEEVVKMENVYDSLDPVDSLSKHAWIFDYWPTLPIGERRTDEKYRAEVVTQQDVAIKEIFDAGGIDAVNKLLDTVPGPETVGKSAGRVYGLNDEILSSTFDHIDGGEWNGRLYAIGYYIALFEVANWKYIEEAINIAKKKMANDKIVASIYLGCPANKLTWKRLEAETDKIQSAYWKEVSNTFRFDVENTEDDYNYGLSKLLEVGRAMDVIEVISYSEKREKTPILIKALEILPHDLNQTSKTKKPIRTNSHSIARVFEKLDEREDITTEEIARLEIPLVRMLSHDRPSLALHNDVLKSPKTFADLMSWAYKPTKGYKDEVTVTKKQKENLAILAWEILHHIPRIPGQTGTAVNRIELNDWIEESIKLCHERGRGKIAEQTVGQILSSSPTGSDGLWPCEEVRDVLEDILPKRPDISIGMEIGVYNSRGVTSRGVYEGGDQEHKLDEKYRHYARVLSSSHPFVSKMLMNIADSYKREALQNDREARLED